MDYTPEDLRAYSKVCFIPRVLKEKRIIKEKLLYCIECCHSDYDIVRKDVKSHALLDFMAISVKLDSCTNGSSSYIIETEAELLELINIVLHLHAPKAHAILELYKEGFIFTVKHTKIYNRCSQGFSVSWDITLSISV